MLLLLLLLIFVVCPCGSLAKDPDPNQLVKTTTERFNDASSDPTILSTITFGPLTTGRLTTGQPSARRSLFKNLLQKTSYFMRGFEDRPNNKYLDPSTSNIYPRNTDVPILRQDWSLRQNNNDTLPPAAQIFLSVLLSALAFGLISQKEKGNVVIERHEGCHHKEHHGGGWKKKKYHGGYYEMDRSDPWPSASHGGPPPPPQGHSSPWGSSVTHQPMTAAAAWQPSWQHPPSSWSLSQPTFRYDHPGYRIDRGDPYRDAYRQAQADFRSRPELEIAEDPGEHDRFVEHLNNLQKLQKLAKKKILQHLTHQQPAVAHPEDSPPTETFSLPSHKEVDYYA